MTQSDTFAFASAPENLLERVLLGQANLLFDGAFGTMLQAQNLATSSPAELLCFTNPAAIGAIHRAYVDAGSQVATTNTFRASHLLRQASEEGADATDTFAGGAFAGDGQLKAEALFAAAVSCARSAHPLLVAADIGPVGELLEPYGDVDPEDAFELFACQVRAAAQAGADFVIIETMTDVQEASLAVQAAKEHTNLPVFASMSFSAQGRTFMGTAPAEAASALVSAGADVVGANCAVGPEQMLPLIEEMRAAVDVPLLAQANAGMPVVDGTQVSYPINAQDFASAARNLMCAGATVIGGCCGTTPAHIAELSLFVLA